MEQYYYNHMNKPQQAAYHSIFVGVKNLSDEIQVPALSGEELYNIFFQMRLDHPEIFWVTNFKYRYYKDSPNLIFIPEYLFEKNKIREHQKALTARVEKLVRPAQKMSEWEKEKYVHDFICENVRYDKLKKAYSHEKAMEMILAGECGTFNPLLLECLVDIQDTLQEDLNAGGGVTQAQNRTKNENSNM